MIKLLKGLAIAYVLVCLLMFAFQRKLIYFPVDDFHFAENHAIMIHLEEATLHGWALNPSAENAVIYYGGNAEAIEYNIQKFQEVFPDRAVFLIPYRGYGKNEGSPSESALYADALAVFDKVAAKHKKVSLIGRSLGSGVATFVAANRSAEKVVLITPFDSIVAIAQQLYPLLPVKYVLLDRFESIQRAAQISVPILMLIAEHDQVVPRVNSNRLEDAFQSEQVKVVLIHGANHNSISGYVGYWTSIARFL